MNFKATITDLKFVPPLANDVQSNRDAILKDIIRFQSFNPSGDIIG